MQLIHRRLSLAGTFVESSSRGRGEGKVDEKVRKADAEEALDAIYASSHLVLQADGVCRVQSSNVFIVFDEADKLLESNVGFGGEIENDLLPHIPSLVQVQKSLFSATDIAQLENFAREVLGCSPTKLIVGGLNAVSSFVDQHLLEVHLSDKHVRLLGLIRNEYGYHGLVWLFGSFIWFF
uniref:Uncharacterized protein n=1 Tax=Parascaris equorum TaxID=6256 RepID=A0A914RWX1_PAREQ